LRRALFDVSFLLALLDDDHVRNEEARKWLTANVEGGWASCPLTQNGFIRIITLPSYTGGYSIIDAMDRLNEAISTDRHEFWSDDVSIADASLFDPTRILGPKQITDLYLLGLAVRHEGRLVTLDRSIPLSPVRGATEDHLYCL
jgi:uncharacterized protein